MLWDQLQVIKESLHNTTGNLHFKTLKTNNGIQYFSSLALVIIYVDPSPSPAFQYTFIAVLFQRFVCIIQQLDLITLYILYDFLALNHM